MKKRAPPTNPEEDVAKSGGVLRYKEVDVAEACSGCLYFRPPKIRQAGATFVLSGLCRRYPGGAQTTADDWCGEFKDA